MLNRKATSQIARRRRIFLGFEMPRYIFVKEIEYFRVSNPLRNARKDPPTRADPPEGDPSSEVDRAHRLRPKEIRLGPKAMI